MTASTTQANRIAGRLIAIFTKDELCEDPVSDIHSLLLEARTCTSAFIVALQEHTASDNRHRSVIASAIVIVCSGQMACQELEEALPAARASLWALVTSENAADERICSQVCGMFMFDAPTNAVEFLMRALFHSAGSVKITAAMALCNVPVESFKHTDLLVHALRDGHPYERLSAGICLYRLNVVADEAEDAILSILPVVPDRAAGIFLGILEQMGERASQFSGVVAALTQRPDATPRLQGRALQTYAMIAGAEARLTVQRAIYSSHPDTCLGAIKASQYLGPLTLALRDALLDFACLGTRDERTEALLALASDRNCALSLMEIAEYETEVSRLRFIGHIMAQQGPQIVSGMMPALESDSMGPRIVVTAVIEELGPPGVAELVRRWPASRLREGSELVSVLVAVMGSRSRDAVVMLGQALQNSENDGVDTRLRVLHALSRLGANAVAAASAVVACCRVGDPIIVRAAIEALEAMGSGAIDAVTQAMESALDEDRPMLEDLRVRIRSRKASDFGPLAHLKTAILLRFVNASRALQGSAIGFREIERRLRDEGKAYMGVSARSLGDAVRDVEKAVARGPLTMRGRARCGQLTREGEKVLALAEELLIERARQESIDKESKMWLQ